MKNKKPSRHQKKRKTRHSSNQPIAVFFRKQVFLAMRAIVNIVITAVLSHSLCMILLKTGIITPEMVSPEVFIQASVGIFAALQINKIE
jgi:uncharacterized membrane protein